MKPAMALQTWLPTAVPSVPPTMQPQNNETDPVACQSTVVLSKDCYIGWAEDVIANFTNCDPQEDDWMGIWAVGENPDYLSEDYFDRKWSCGNQTCLGAPKTNQVVFQKGQLQLGRYQIFLVNEIPDKGPYLSEAESAVFEIANVCGLN